MINVATLAGGWRDPDAELIRLCEEHIANVRAFNCGPAADSWGVGDGEDPLIRACDATQAAIAALPSQTLAGAIAKARVAKVEAIGARGSEVWDEALAGQWARAVVNDLIGLA
jgi:hypothetical protein